MTSKYEQQAKARKRKRKVTKLENTRSGGPLPFKKKVHEVQTVAKDGKGKKYYTYNFDGGKKKYPGDGKPKAKTIKKYTKKKGKK